MTRASEEEETIMMNPSQSDITQLEQAQKELKAAQDKLLALKRSAPLPITQNYPLQNPSGDPAPLFSLFGERDELMVIHNMGKGCRYCTLWADGFNGLFPHFQNRAGFVVVTPDRPEIIKEFAASRGWRFPIYSSYGTSFFKDLGFASPEGKPWPGVSTFLRNPDSTVTRVAADFFGPGDNYCSVWPLFDLLPRGVNDWEPQYKY
jgi:predicted dithiol-disulfide oxidoreductase (DUF899 family)